MHRLFHCREAGGEPMRHRLKNIGKEIGICRGSSRMLHYNLVALQPYNLTALQPCNVAVSKMSSLPMRWRESCHDPPLKYYRQLFWSSVFIQDVPEKHAVPIAWKLTEHGGPFPARHPLDLIKHFKAIAVKDDLVMWVMSTDAIYSTIH